MDFIQARQETTQHAREVLEHLYQVLLATPIFTLSNGSTAVVARYVPPEINKDGEATCGFDVRLKNGSHLEFTVRNTGWGKSFADEITKQRGKQGKHER